MSQKTCFVANWKMHKTNAQAKSYFRDFEKGWPQQALPAEAVFAPTFTAMATLSGLMKDAALPNISLSAQNVHFESAGAFTGEISAEMLFELGCRYVIIGHSERRHLFGEDDSVVHRKVVAALESSLCPILCVGETREDRQAGETWGVLEQQLSIALEDANFAERKGEAPSSWMIAYEPVWAIGSGETPQPHEVSETHRKIQHFVGDQLKKGCPRVLYGGSVSEKNIATFMKEEAITGVLVGGASLSADSFLNIIQLGAKAKESSKKQGAS